MQMILKCTVNVVLLCREYD